MRRSLAALAAVTLTSLLAMPTLAQPSSLQADLGSLVAAERAFSKLSEEKGLKEAFVTFIADDGILFRGGAPVKGKEWTAARPSPPIKLVWWPTHADIALSGDLGWTTGPYEVREEGHEEPAGRGYFITVWRKQADGRWRFAIDSGNHLEDPRQAETDAPGPLKAEKAKAPKPKKADAVAEKAGLLAADRELGQATAQGAAAAYAARFADDGRLIRNLALPYVGKEALKAGLGKLPAKVTSQPTDGGVSEAGDLGYTYGDAEWQDGQTAVKGNYMRIWEKRGGTWKLMADCLNEIPPPPPAEPKPGG